MEGLIGPAFARELEAGRDRFNARFAQARRAFPGLDGGAWLDCLRHRVDPIVSALADQDPGRLSDAVEVAPRHGPGALRPGHDRPRGADRRPGGPVDRAADRRRPGPRPRPTGPDRSALERPLQPLLDGPLPARGLVPGHGRPRRAVRRPGASPGRRPGGRLALRHGPLPRAGPGAGEGTPGTDSKSTL